MSHESGPGGNNGKRAVAWDYFDIKSQKQHRCSTGKLVFTVKGTPVMKMKMTSNLPKAGCDKGEICGHEVNVTTTGGTTPMLHHLRNVSKKGAKTGIGRDKHTAAVAAHDAGSCNTSTAKDAD